MRTWAATVIAVAACGGGSSKGHGDAATDGPPAIDAAIDAAQLCPGPPPQCVPTSAPTTPATGSASCSPLTQTGCLAGEKCTWLHDAPGAGHIGCAPVGMVQTDCPCTYGANGATGYDDCMQGLVCNGGSCRAICDPQGGNPMCNATHACSTYQGLFTTGTSTPAAAGVCDLQCDPLADNDIAGSGHRGCSCGAGSGCYGLPSAGVPPKTAFTCSPLGNATLVHRSPVVGMTSVNSCAQGYLPLFRESTGNTTVVCVALCQPLNCYAGNCGSNDSNRFGAAPHRCMNPDARGTFNGSANGDECEYLWAEEVNSGTLLRSPFSDTVGVCFDHSKYKYDPSGGNNPTVELPACQDLQLRGSGTDPNNPLTYYGAVDFGCVDSITAGLPPRRPALDIRLGTLSR